MEMSKKEIIRAYRDRPNAKRIQEIADKYGVTANAIRKILKDAGEDVAVFGPGRPKKNDLEEAADTTLQKADEVLKDKEEQMCIKSESASEQIKDCSIPKAVYGLCRERIANINRQIQVYVEQVDLLNSERNEIVEFLEREKDGDKEGVHGEV